MKIIYIAVLTTFFTFNSIASTEPSNRSLENLSSTEEYLTKSQAPSVKMSVGLGIGYSSYNGTLFSLKLNPEFAITDDLYMGVLASYDNFDSSYTDKYSLGLSASYDFFKVSNITFFGQQELTWATYNGTNIEDRNDYYGITRAGIRWFIFDLYAFTQNYIDDSEIDEDSSGFGWRIVFQF